MMLMLPDVSLSENASSRNRARPIEDDKTMTPMVTMTAECEREVMTMCAGWVREVLTMTARCEREMVTKGAEWEKEVVTMFGGSGKR